MIIVQTSYIYIYIFKNYNNSLVFWSEIYCKQTDIFLYYINNKFFFTNFTLPFSSSNYPIFIELFH